MSTVEGPNSIKNQLVLDLDSSNIKKSLLPRFVRLNLMRNPSCETNVNYYIQDAGIDRTCTVARSSDTAFSGSFSAKFVPKIGKGTTGNRFVASIKDATGTAITKSKTYTASLYVRIDATLNVKLKIKWFDASGIELSETAGPRTSTQNGVWTRLYATGTAPSTATHVGLYVEEDTQFEYPFRQNMIPNPSFEVNTSDWQQPGNTTLTRVTNTFVYGSASMSLTSQAAGDIAARYSYGTGGLPVVAGQTYTFSVFVRSETVSRNARIFFQWFTDNTFLSGSTGSDNSTIVGEWRRIFVTATAPANANYAMPQITIQSTAAAGEIHYIDAALVEQVSSFNLLEYSGFNTGTTGWLGAGSNTNIAVNNDALSGKTSLQMTAVALGTILAEPTFPASAIKISPSTAYVASVKFKANNTARSCRINILWYDSAKAYISGTTGSNITDSNNSWTTASVTGTSPSNAEYAIVQLAIDNVAASESHFADEVLFQQGSTVNSYVNSRYFDGSIGDAPYWNGTANASQSIDAPPIYIDSVMIEPASRYNLMTNGLFLNNTSGWSINVNTAPGTISHITDVGPIGDSGLTTAMQVTTLAATRLWNLFQGAITMPKSIIPSAQYTLSFWARTLHGSSVSTYASILRGDGIQGVSCGNYTIDPNNWKKISLTFNGSGIVSSSAVLYMALPTSTASIIQYAGFVLEPGSTGGIPLDSSYFDGSTSSYSWDGTAHDSQSRTSTGSIWYDLSGNNNNATLIGRTTTEIDSVPCFNFKENASSLTSGNTASGSYEGFSFSSNPITTTGDFTFRAIVKDPLNTVGQASIFANAGAGDGYRFGIGKNGIYYLVGPTYKESTIAFLSTLNSTSWYDVCCVFSRSTQTITLYLNGIYQGQDTIPAQSASVNAVPGLVRTACCSPWIGKLSKFSAYNKALSATEVLQNFNAIRGRYGI